MSYWTPNEVAGRLRISKMTVYRLIANGELTAVKIGRSYRIPHDALDRYVKNNTKEGKS